MWCPSRGRKGKGGAAGDSPRRPDPVSVQTVNSERVRPQLTHLRGKQEAESIRREKGQLQKLLGGVGSLLFQITLGMNFAYISLNVLRRREIEEGGVKPGLEKNPTHH